MTLNKPLHLSDLASSIKQRIGWVSLHEPYSNISLLCPTVATKAGSGQALQASISATAPASPAGWCQHVSAAKCLHLALGARNQARYAGPLQPQHVSPSKAGFCSFSDRCSLTCRIRTDKALQRSQERASGARPGQRVELMIPCLLMCGFS